MANDALLMSWRERWNRNLLRFLSSRARQLDVEDLAQETYLRLLRAPDLSEVRNPEAYLISVANHVLAEWHHRHTVLWSAQELHDDLPADDIDLQLQVDGSLSQGRLEEALVSMPPALRAVLLLRLRDDRSSKEIAQILDVSPRQVKRYLARGYDQLRRKLES